MLKTLLDTDMFSEYLKAKNNVVVTRATAYLVQFNRLTLSAITIMEIVEGLHKKRMEERVQQFLALLPTVETLPFNGAIAAMAGRINADLERVGQPIGAADVMIAATALHHNLVLATGNSRHYERIQALGYALRLENWRNVTE